MVNIPIFLDEGADVFVYDPIGVKNLKKIYPQEITYCEYIGEALKDADICFIFTDWDSVRKLKYDDFRNMKKAIIIDGRNCYQLSYMAQYPVIYESIGRKTIVNI